MAESEDTETAEETTEAPAAEETPATDEAPAGGDAAVTDEAPAAPDAPVAAAEPEPILPPKERRRQRRSAHAGEARPSRSPEDRQAERDAERRRKAAARTRYRGKLKQRTAERRAAEGPREPTPPAEHGSGRQKVRQGIVVSDKADKTITVRIDMARRHRRYKKIVRSSSTLHAHDESNDANAGDTVRVVESRPLSRTKRWRLLEVLERAR